MLGPLLFILYINDLADLQLGSKMVVYADDILLYYYHYYYYHGFTVRYSVLVTGTENADIKMRYLLKAGLYVLQNARLCTCIVTINILFYNQ